MESNGVATRPVAPSNDARQRQWAGDDALAERARLGDDDAFTRLHERFEHDIFNYLYRQSNDEELARDLTQDVFLKAWLAIMKTKPGLRVRPWLYRIALRRYLDHYRHVQLVRMERFDCFFDAQGNQLMTQQGFLHGGGRGFVHITEAVDKQPEEVVFDAELREQVQRILDTLHPKYRMCLLLREYHDLSYDEIADVLDTTRSAIKSLLFRAREEFRQVYAKRAQAGEAVPV